MIRFGLILLLMSWVKKIWVYTYTGCMGLYLFAERMCEALIVWVLRGGSYSQVQIQYQTRTLQM